ncbi:site-specific DNA-methyltransferase [Paenibacillus timonensis]|uniref:Site-specific DNA-methyltransferase n=1 Tax=Paenibacillus timonensis TaxID=225915 RepID=A0ABW3SC12_9BACL|nr:MULTISPECIES: site-specific DNA-methyltransferase [Paenibacillus]MCH1640881.1 site-specific DNA-methyltransferase [Paenibacillus timonensis]MDU2239230.1 site-specific DNA-methyltransferase [Paenibacillus sp.]
MNKLTMKSVDLTQVNIDKIAELFPNVITEARDEQGKIKRAVDFDLLKQELSDILVEGEKERYQLTWPGKKEAILQANATIDKTLRPVKEDSVNWENTQNLYIEGDNLEVLKLLQESYLNKVKMIYIDPPYNTGNDFIYKDDFKESSEEYLEESGQADSSGNRLVPNPSTNGRFHSDWLTMIYSRLKVARNLLREDGLIFLSIDENEVDNLRKVCNEVFGRENYITSIVWEKRFTRSNNAKMFASLTDYILLYRKSPQVAEIKEQRNEKSDSIYSNPDNDPRGVWTSVSYVNPATKEQRPNLVYSITNPINGSVVVHPTNAWKYEYSTHEKHVKENRLYWGKNGENTYPRLKKFLSELDGGIVPVNLWFHKDVGTTDAASKQLEELMGKKLFDFPKPASLINRMIRLATSEDDIILDFFSGSATTAHAVMQLNAEDQGNRKFIMVQLPEETIETSEAYKTGYKNICEIGKERIRRAAKKIKEETGADIDYGFRVYRVDSSNMKDVYYTPEKLGQMNLDDMASNIKEDRTGEDLLIQVMLECGLELSLPMESKEIEGKTVHYVAGNSLIACFDEEVSESLIQKIAEDQPLRVVFRDSSFRDDSARINVEELFKLLSPSTEIQVL